MGSSMSDAQSGQVRKLFEHGELWVAQKKTAEEEGEGGQGGLSAWTVKYTAEPE